VERMRAGSSLMVVVALLSLSVQVPLLVNAASIRTRTRRSMALEASCPCREPSDPRALHTKLHDMQEVVHALRKACSPDRLDELEGKLREARDDLSPLLSKTKEIGRLQAEAEKLEREAKQQEGQITDWLSQLSTNVAKETGIDVKMMQEHLQAATQSFELAKKRYEQLIAADEQAKQRMAAAHAVSASSHGSSLTSASASSS